MRHGTRLALALSLAAATAAGAQSRPAAAPVTLIRNATVMTASRGDLANTDILLRDGKIAAIGTGITAPAGAVIIDASGKYVTPGIIDAHSHVMSDAVNEGSLSVTSMVRISDVLNNTTPSIYRQLAGGITTTHILHGSANTIGGQNAIVKLKYGRSIADMMFPGAPPGIKFALGENVKRSSRTAQPGQEARYPTTRMGQAEVLREAFTKAQDYKASWTEYEAAKRAGRQVAPPRRDLELEPLVEILEGKRDVHAHSYRSDEIVMLLNLADEFGFKIQTLQHVLEGYRVAPEIAKHGAGASTFADSWAYKIEAYEAIPHNAAVMTRAGINVSLNSDSDERARRMNIEAAKMVKYGGLSDQEALRLITLNPAIQLRIDNKVGSIDIGKDADVVIWNDHPLSVYARVETTFIDGEVFFDRATDIRLRDEELAERRRLQQEEPNRGGAPARAGAPAGRGGDNGTLNNNGPTGGQR